MNVKLKILLPLLVVIGLVGIGSFYFGQTLTPITTFGVSGTGATHAGFVCVEVYRVDGSKEFLGCHHNLYSNYGKNATRQIFFGAGGSAAFNVISTGIENATIAATDRCIANQTGAGAFCKDWNANGLQPAVGTVSEVRGGPNDFGNVSITKTFTCMNCANTPINATGLYNSTALTDLSLFAEANFTTATLQTNDQINITFFIWSV